MRTLTFLIALLFAVPSYGAEFLVFTIDKGNETAGYKKGDIIEVFEDGRLQPQYPDVPFVLIRVPGMAVDKIYQSEWRQYLGYEILASNAQGFRIRIYAKVARVSDNLGGLTRTKVENFIVNHGGIVISVSQNEVVFDIGRSDVGALKEDILNFVERKFIRRRLWKVPVAAVDAALANGGVMTYTEIQALNYLTRKAD